MRGGRLAQVEHWQDETDIALTEEERRYVAASLEQRDNEAAATRRRRRQQLLALVGMLVIVSGLAATALLQRSVARGEARDAHVRELAGEATLALEEDPERAVLIALEAVALSRSDGAEPLPEAVGALQQAVQGLRLVARFDAGGPLAVLGGDDPIVVLGDDARVTVRSLADGSTIDLPASGGVSPVAAHTGAGLIAVGSGPEAEETGVALHRRGGEPVELLPGPSGQPFIAVDIAPAGDRVIGTSCRLSAQRFCTTKPVVTVWDRATGTSAEVAVEGRPGASAFITDDVVAILTSAPDGVVLRDLVQETSTFVPVTDGPLDALALDDAGTRIAVTGVEAGAITLIDVGAAAVTEVLPSSRENVVAWSPDGRLAATGNVGLVRIIDVASGEVELELQGTDDNLFFVTFTPDGRSVLASSYDRTWMWDVSRQGPAALEAIAPPLGPSRGHALSADGELLSSSRPPQGIEVIEVATSRQVAAATDAMVTIDVGINVESPDFTLIGMVATDGTSTIRRLPDLTIAYELEDCTNALAFSADDTLALVGGSACPDDIGGEVTPSRVVSIDDGETILELEHPWVFSAAFTPAGVGAGRYLALTEQFVVELHDLETGERVATVTPEDVGSDGGGPLTTVFDSSGRHLAVGMSDGRTWVLDVPALVGGATISEALVFNQVTHTGAAPGPAITADGVIATAGFDELVRLWDLESGDLLTEFRTDMSAAFPSLRWNAHEDELLYADGGVIRRFPRDVDDLVALAAGMVTRELTPDECVRHLDAERCVS
jgi:WD40 repeat protein